jgi:hypothetical protein
MVMDLGVRHLWNITEVEVKSMSGLIPAVVVIVSWPIYL